MEHSASSASMVLHVFFFNDTATTEIYTLSLHDALPICHRQTWSWRRCQRRRRCGKIGALLPGRRQSLDRKSTRLNSSHDQISYAVFCLKKKKHIAKWHLTNSRILYARHRLQYT